jgi:hypothetical protein
MQYIKEYRTTVAGVAAVLGALAHLLNALANGDTSTIIADLTAFSGGLGLIFAKDAKAQ